jgi:hypothetical protein
MTLMLILAAADDDELVVDTRHAAYDLLHMVLPIQTAIHSSARTHPTNQYLPFPKPTLPSHFTPQQHQHYQTPLNASPQHCIATVTASCRRWSVCLLGRCSSCPSSCAASAPCGLWGWPCACGSQRCGGAPCKTAQQNSGQTCAAATQDMHSLACVCLLQGCGLMTITHVAVLCQDSGLEGGISEPMLIAPL